MYNKLKINYKVRTGFFMEHSRLLDVFNKLQDQVQEQLESQAPPLKIDLRKVPDFIDNTIKVLLPEYYFSNQDIDFTLNNLTKLHIQVQQLLSYTGNKQLINQNSLAFIEKIPELRAIILQDIKAAYQKDPAAKSYQEIVLTYPGVFSIIVHRISHEFYKMGYTLIARVISEYSHSKTGIDIHPGATIGHSFFMDHGTGIVIGETTIIGNNVTVYQGVTLGAFSFQRDHNGEIIKGGNRRHPVLEDDVTVYAGATILGGETVIGKGSVVGGNVWLTKSLPPRSKVITKIQNKML
ncbi:serine O-acetyltransferase EpsC [Neobacillus mesonae]|uniref:serine O-acetyltransferase EpsC n=1 Tax=Neobacillus mesonae TaxID=1193713 RepID=UPI00203CA829|nr:serine O-acetyltransferase EpsC [Neobacillus mesonae]MCM3570755.1 serine acetyltransferase [Neobacillus mesonae]